MPSITLPDGSQRNFDNPVSVMDVAADIGPGLAKATLAGRVNDVIVDATHIMTEDSSLAIITERDEDGLEIIRHTTAHLLAQAVQQLFPDAQVTIGPVIENGFYYDFAYEPGFSPDDLVTIEKRMKEIVKQDLPIARSVMSREEAIPFFLEKGEKYKENSLKPFLRAKSFRCTRWVSSLTYVVAHTCHPRASLNPSN